MFMGLMMIICGVLYLMSGCFLCLLGIFVGAVGEDFNVIRFPLERSTCGVYLGR